MPYPMKKKEKQMGNITETGHFEKLIQEQEGVSTNMIQPSQYVEAVLKSTSSNVVNIPQAIIEELGWKINEDVEVQISNVSNDDFDWQEVQIIRKVDAQEIFKDEEE